MLRVRDGGRAGLRAVYEGTRPLNCLLKAVVSRVLRELTRSNEHFEHFVVLGGLAKVARE